MYEDDGSIADLDRYLKSYLDNDSNYGSWLKDNMKCTIEPEQILEKHVTAISDNSVSENDCNDDNDDNVQEDEDRNHLICPTYCHFNSQEDCQPVELMLNKDSFTQSIENEFFQILTKSYDIKSTEENITDIPQFKDILTTRLASIYKKMVDGCDHRYDSLSAEYFMYYMTTYKDIAFCLKSSSNDNLLKSMTILHILNHLQKCQKRIDRNNKKLKEKESHEHINITADKIDIYDQGFNRTRVLILLPSKEACLQYVNVMISIMEKSATAQKVTITNRKRFNDEYGPSKDDLEYEKSLEAFPLDHQQCFKGNMDDNFRIGVELVTKTYLKLYSSFKNSDIIIASPIGLKTLFTQDDNVDESHINNEVEVFKDFDCLSSIEILVIDDAFMLQMQNWEHLIDCINMINCIPTTIGETDFSRVYRWACDQKFKFYRQTIVINRYENPAVISLINNLSSNFEGNIIFRKTNLVPFINDITTPISIIFHGFHSDNFRIDHEKRFEIFITTIFQKYQTNNQNNIAIFIPNYMDFVKIRNYFITKNVKFAPISEYTELPLVSRFRIKFKQQEYPILLFTERYFFYNRHRITGIKHLIFYQLPTNPHLFPHLVNLIKIEDCDSQRITQISNKYTSSNKATQYSNKNNDDNYSCRVLYSNYDGHSLREIVGVENATENLIASNNTHHILYPNCI